MTSLLKVNVVTPFGTVYENEAKMIVLESSGGQLGIMANHEPLISNLKIGPLKVILDNNKTDYLTINGGFVEFQNNTASIVADSAEKESDIDLSRAEAAKKRALERLNKANEDSSRFNARANVALARAINRINVASK